MHRRLCKLALPQLRLTGMSGGLRERSMEPGCCRARRRALGGGGGGASELLLPAIMIHVLPVKKNASSQLLMTLQQMQEAVFC